MELNHTVLKSVCFEFAQSAMWERKPTDVAAIQTFANLVYDAAIFHVEFIQSQQRNPDIVTECVRYLTLKHAIPPMRDDIAFVRNSLEVLIELACPNQGVSLEQESFFKEILQGISEARTDAHTT